MTLGASSCKELCEWAFESESDASTYDDSMSRTDSADTSVVTPSVVTPSVVTPSVVTPGYQGLCTHRTYARNLYVPGQTPSLSSIDETS